MAQIKMSALVIDNALCPMNVDVHRNTLDMNAKLLSVSVLVVLTRAFVVILEIVKHLTRALARMELQAFSAKCVHLVMWATCVESCDVMDNSPTTPLYALVMAHA